MKSRRERGRLVLIGRYSLNEQLIRSLLKEIRLKLEVGDLD